MQAKLIFNLPEDQYEYNHCFNAVKYIAALEDIATHIRNKLKYNKLTPAESDVYEQIKKDFYEILEENGIELFID